VTTRYHDTVSNNISRLLCKISGITKRRRPKVFRCKSNTIMWFDRTIYRYLQRPVDRPLSWFSRTVSVRSTEYCWQYYDSPIIIGTRRYYITFGHRQKHKHTIVSYIITTRETQTWVFIFILFLSRDQSLCLTVEKCPYAPTSSVMDLSHSMYGYLILKLDVAPSTMCVRPGV